MEVSVCTNRPILAPCGLKGIAYQVDPYVGCEHLCYYCYAMENAETDWSREIQTYPNIVDQLREELETIPPQTIYMGYQTDPYQPSEDEHRQTRKVLELFLEKGFSASILTKSDLVVRDSDLLKKMSAAAVCVSVAFNDDATRQLFEAHTMATEKRVDALRQLKDAGIRTGALVCPVIPYITDPIPLIDMLASCTDEIWVYGLSINDRSGKNWRHVQKILRTSFPDLVAPMKEVLFSKDHPYWAQLRDNLAARKNDRQLHLNIHL